MNWREHITVDTEIYHGRASITGTRFRVIVIVENLAAGLDAHEVARSYPSITTEAVHAAFITWRN